MASVTAATANRVFADERGIVRNVYVGDQTYESVKAVEAATLALVAEQEARGLPVLILGDLKSCGLSSAGSRRAAKEALLKVPQGRVAVFGGNVFTKHLANFILLASGKGESARYCDTEEEAVAWLVARSP
jgi:hypothetical protein